MTTSANVIEFDIFKGEEKVGYFRRNVLCKYPLYSDLLKYQPLKEHTISAHGYDDEEEYWECDEPENLEDFLRDRSYYSKELKEYFQDHKT